MLVINFIKICLFGEVLSDEFIEVSVCSSLLGMIGFCEVEINAKISYDLLVNCNFFYC